MLWFSSSWSINTWSMTKLRSSDWRPESGLNTKGWSPSRPPVISWWLKIIRRSQSSMKACKAEQNECSEKSRKENMKYHWSNFQISPATIKQLLKLFSGGAVCVLCKYSIVVSSAWNAVPLVPGSGAVVVTFSMSHKTHIQLPFLL